MEINELKTKLEDAKFSLDSARSKGVMITARQESMKNILYNNADAIIEALKFAADAEKQVKVLELEIDDADAELDEKDALIRELKAHIAELEDGAPANKTKKKTKEAEPDVPDAGETGAGDDAGEQ